MNDGEDSSQETKDAISREKCINTRMIYWDTFRFILYFYLHLLNIVENNIESIKTV